MSISHIEQLKKQLRKTAKVYVAVSVFCAVTAFVYAMFSHGAHSVYMDLMFLFPLLGGTLLFLLISFACPSLAKRFAFRLGFNLYNSGIASLTCGSALLGILEIAGTGSDFVSCFFICGTGLAATGVLIVLSSKKRKKYIDRF